jgi:hypothetical protein
LIVLARFGWPDLAFDIRICEIVLIGVGPTCSGPGDNHADAVRDAKIFLHKHHSGCRFRLPPFDKSMTADRAAPSRRRT